MLIPNMVKIAAPTLAMAIPVRNNIPTSRKMPSGENVTRTKSGLSSAYNALPIPVDDDFRNDFVELRIHSFPAN